MQTELEIVDMKNPKSNKYCMYYFLQQCYGLKIYIQANIQ